ncbi:MAG TPA: hypothetical protein VIK14_14595 [Ignavibacteria bacterium]
MAAPTPEELKSFGELIEPFQRNTRGKTKSSLKPAHATNSLESGIGDKIFDATNDGMPHHPTEINFVTDEVVKQIDSYQIQKEQKKAYCFLWLLNEEGLKILWENVKNLLDEEDGEVKHTNITEAGLAFHGGELFFTNDKRIFVNNKSDRYGDSKNNHWKAVIGYFRKTYNEFQIIDLKPDDL